MITSQAAPMIRIGIVKTRLFGPPPAAGEAFAYACAIVVAPTAVLSFPSWADPATCPCLMLSRP